MNEADINTLKQALRHAESVWLMAESRVRFHSDPVRVSGPEADIRVMQAQIERRRQEIEKSRQDLSDAILDRSEAERHVAALRAMLGEHAPPPQED